MKTNQAIIVEEEENVNYQSTENDLNEFAAEVAQHTIEQLIIAHSESGIDVTDPRYIEGITLVMEAITGREGSGN